MGSAYLKNQRLGFTLLELIIVIGIIAILGTVVVLVLNPAQMFAQSRDIGRISDLQNISDALVYYQAVGGADFGSNNVIYVSLPSDQPNCSDLILPSPPVSWSYACQPAASYRNIDGTGWMPLDLTTAQGTVGTLLSSLPVDPINTALGDYYYTYIHGTDWTVSSTLESTKYLTESAAYDGGEVSTRYESGKDLALNSNLTAGGGISGTIYATGGTITTDGSYTIHTFTSSGTFTVTSGSGDIAVLVVAGGGNGGWAGGGGGGVVYKASHLVSAQAYSVTVGGSNSDSIFDTITANGGGLGQPQAPVDGGSGGGAWSGQQFPTPGVATQGNSGGGIGYGNAGAVDNGCGAGGGGGAGTVASNCNGGNGFSSSISGSPVVYGGGGGGFTNGIGGTGGGGNGATTQADNGAPNTGGGGGGSYYQQFGLGGSGIVIIRYLTP